MARYNQPQEGSPDWNVPLNQNFADLGIEVTEEVSSWSDLPSPGDTSKSSNGQWPVYRVADDRVFVRVTDSSREIVGGLGSSGHPLPETHHRVVYTEEIVNGEVHDVVVYSGVRTDERQDFYIRAIDRNGVVDEFIGDVVNSWQATARIIRSAFSAADTANQKSGLVRVMPQTGRVLNLENPDTASEPYFSVPNSVTFDIRGCYFRTLQDGAAFVDMAPSATVLGHGCYVFGDQLTGFGVRYDAASGSIGVQDGAKVLGYPQFADTQPGFFGVGLRQTSGGSIAGTVTEIHLDNAAGAVSVESSGVGGFVNDNEIIVSGSTTGGTTRGASATRNIVEFIGVEPMRSNHVHAKQLQTKGTPDDVGRFEAGAAKNKIAGVIADQNMAVNGYTFAAGVSNPNTVTTSYGTITVTNNSGVAQNYIEERGGNLITQDLTALSGVAGQVATHDGTDGAVAVPWGDAQWDPNKAAGAGNWVSLVDGTVFGPN